MAERDPRINPQRGDRIRQAYGGAVLVVMAVDGDKVTWCREKRASKSNVCYVDRNSWSITGWQRVIACGAYVFKNAAELGGVGIVSNCCCVGPQNGEPLCPCKMLAVREHKLAIANIYEQLASQQEPLGSEFEKVWSDNVEQLYED